MNKFLLTTLLFLLLYSFSNAQGCDPWIVQAYKQLYQRVPNNEECNIKNYNNGSWNNYNELLGYIKAFQSKKTTSMPALTGDPWIFQAYKELYNRQPNAWELNIKNYNNGSWNNYEELKKYISEFQGSLNKQNLQIKTAPFNNNVLVGFYINGQQVAVNVVAPGGGNVIAAGGGNVIAAGGGNVISPGGGNVISPGGGNVIAAGGGNIIINSNMAGVNFGGRYSVQSAGTKVVTTSGNGALIIK